MIIPRQRIFQERIYFPNSRSVSDSAYQEIMIDDSTKQSSLTTMPSHLWIDFDGKDESKCLYNICHEPVCNIEIKYRLGDPAMPKPELAISCEDQLAIDESLHFIKLLVARSSRPDCANSKYEFVARYPLSFGRYECGHAVS